MPSTDYVSVSIYQFLPINTVSIIMVVMLYMTGLDASNYGKMISFCLSSSSMMMSTILIVLLGAMSEKHSYQFAKKRLTVFAKTCLLFFMAAMTLFICTTFCDLYSIDSITSFHHEKDYKMRIVGSLILLFGFGSCFLHLLLHVLE